MEDLFWYQVFLVGGGSLFIIFVVLTQLEERIQDIIHRDKDIAQKLMGYVPCRRCKRKGKVDTSGPPGSAGFGVTSTVMCRICHGRGYVNQERLVRINR
jgi:DnaJ-class molecular chaperone